LRRAALRQAAPGLVALRRVARDLRRAALRRVAPGLRREAGLPGSWLGLARPVTPWAGRQLQGRALLLAAGWSAQRRLERAPLLAPWLQLTAAF
jgi:hypothetical protein